jgi:hypothetical protein
MAGGCVVAEYSGSELTAENVERAQLITTKEAAQ